MNEIIFKRAPALSVFQIICGVVFLGVSIVKISIGSAFGFLSLVPSFLFLSQGLIMLATPYIRINGDIIKINFSIFKKLEFDLKIIESYSVKSSKVINIKYKKGSQGDFRIDHMTKETRSEFLAFLTERIKSLEKEVDSSEKI